MPTCACQVEEILHTTKLGRKESPKVCLSLIFLLMLEMRVSVLFLQICRDAGGTFAGDTVPVRPCTLASQRPTKR